MPKNELAPTAFTYLGQAELGAREVLVAMSYW